MEARRGDACSDESAARSCSYCCQLPRKKDDAGIWSKSTTEPKLKRCSRCRSIWYCSIDCQKADFPRHKRECKEKKDLLSKQGDHRGDQMQYKVEERDGRGRCLVATRTIRTKEKERIGGGADQGSWRPLIPPILLEERRETHCALCFDHLSQRLHDSGVPPNPIYRLKFCSDECRSESTRQGLIDEERAIGRLFQSHSNVPPRIFSTAILLYRMVLRLHDETIRNQLDRLQSKPPSTTSFHALSNESDDNHAQHHMQAVIATVMGMLQYTGDLSLSSTSGAAKVPTTLPSLGSLTAMVWQIRLNGFSICDGESVAHGIGLFANPASFINHSCGNANALQTFWFQKGRQPSLCLTGFGSADIAPGQEICISYADTFRPSYLRQAQVKRDYYFGCTCQACVAHVQEEDAWRMGMLCPNCHTAVGQREDIMSPSPSSYKCPSCENMNFARPLRILKSFEAQQKKRPNHPSSSLSQLLQTYQELKEVCRLDSWYVQEAGEQLLQATLDKLSKQNAESATDQQRLAWEALNLAQELLGVQSSSNSAHSNSNKTTSTFLRRQQLLYKAAKLRLFCMPDPHQSIHELQEVLTALSPYYPKDHALLLGLRMCLAGAM